MRNERGLLATLFAWNDLLLSIFGACIILFAILMTKINMDKAVQEDAAAAETGLVSVYCFWQDGVDADVDIHVMGPDRRRVFYNFMQGNIWSLLRDDQGNKDDPGPRNFENVATRGLVPGEYIVNLHLYRVGDQVQLPVLVDCEARIAGSQRSASKPPLVLREQVSLEYKYHEDTAFRFSLYSDGRMVPGSANRDFKSIIRE
jgi:hypothetical protein